MTNEDRTDRQRHLVVSLARVLGSQDGPAQIFETHISWVLVAGKFAWKLKKAVRFDFLDFSTLDARRFFCHEELRLNRRLAPEIYIDVVPVTGTPDRPEMGGSGIPVEYAVKMRAFEQDALWSHRIPCKLLTPGEIDDLAEKIARFHQNTARAMEHTAWGTPAVLQATADENLALIRNLIVDDNERQWISELTTWDGAQRHQLHDIFAHRKVSGCIRECHGDLHGGNIVTVDRGVQAFDCIEFNDSLRWIDVMNDIAFTCMDLRFQGRGNLAARFLNRYLGQTGDYAGLSVLRYYEIQRALVRAKIALLRECQQDESDSGQSSHAYLEYAISGIQPKPPSLMITHGFSGCGKTTFAERVVELAGAVQLRSDVEHKRIRGLAATDRMLSALDGGLYDCDTTRLTYQHLLDLTKQVVQAGWTAIVDAAFLKKEQRMEFADLAAGLGVPFFIFDIRANLATMRSRIVARTRLERDASDAGLDVLDQQLVRHEPLSDDEASRAITVDMENGFDRDALQYLFQNWPQDGVDMPHADGSIRQYDESRRGPTSPSAR